MKIRLNNVSKRYSSHWIIKKLSYDFSEEEVYAIRGGNGSGKSTLLKILSGFLSPSLGTVIYQDNKGPIGRDDVYKYLSFSAPYISSFKSLRINEMLDFYCKFKTVRSGMNQEELWEQLSLPMDPRAFIGELSSGQLQRLNIGTAILQNTRLLLLDEPGSFLDSHSREWFLNLLKNHLSDRLCIIASNDDQDLKYTTKQLLLH